MFSCVLKYCSKSKYLLTTLINPIPMSIETETIVTVQKGENPKVCLLSSREGRSREKVVAASMIPPLIPSNISCLR